MSSRFLSRRIVLAAVAAITLGLAVVASVRAGAPSLSLGITGSPRLADSAGR